MSTDLTMALTEPTECTEGVTRRDEFQPCDKPAVAVRLDPECGEPYPVCARHARADMVPLPDVIAAVRAQVATEVDEVKRAVGTNYTPGHYAGLAHAARIARGESA